MAKNLKKGQRIGRAPKTGTELAFSASRDRIQAVGHSKAAGQWPQPGGVAWVAAMFWIYWDTFWSLFFSAVWFMTIVSHPDAEITDRQRRWCHVNFHIDPKTIEQPNEQMEHA
jgi:hypothetical protein